MKYAILVILLSFACNKRIQATPIEPVQDNFVTALRNQDIRTIKSFFASSRVAIYQIESNDFLNNPTSESDFRSSNLFFVLFDTKSAKRILWLTDASSFYDAYTKGQIIQKGRTEGGVGEPYILAKYGAYVYAIHFICKKNVSKQGCKVSYLEITHP